MSDITVHMKYSKYLPEKKRRETWEELVQRNMQMHLKKYPALETEILNAYQYVFNKKVLPSMRSFQFAGKPIELNPARGYNCCALAIEDKEAFSEIMFLLLSGCGVGYSVQQHHIDKLPSITKPTETKRFLISDCIEGWSDAVKVLIKAYMQPNKRLPIFDYSDIRSKGTFLKTSGGRAPGPEGLKKSLDRVKVILDSKNEGDKLSSLEVHDIICVIAEAVLSGGIRRAALICLFSEIDNDMLLCKSNFKVNKFFKGNIEDFDSVVLNVEEPFYGEREHTFIVSDNKLPKHLSHIPVISNWQLTEIETGNPLPWFYCHPQRSRSNNSVTLYRPTLTEDKFKSILKIVEDSKCGEPGIYLTNDLEALVNPCGEIYLRNKQFCNLSTNSVTNVVSQEDLNERVKVVSFISTLQAGYTDFHYLSNDWKKNSEEEALLGVSMTGIASAEVLKLNLKEAAEVACKENERVAKLIGINKAARVTTIKPEGTGTLALGAIGSGIHAAHAPYYIRRIRVEKDKAIYSYLQKICPEILEDEYFAPDKMAVISIPQQCPEGYILRNEDPLDLLERVKRFYNEWVKPGHRSGVNTHNVSVTVSIKDDEWSKVGEWMWNNRESYSGISLLPYDGGTYIQAPFEDCTKEKYEELYNLLKDIDLTQIIENEDNTSLTEQVACAGGNCEV